MSLIRIRWSYRSRTYFSVSDVIPGIWTTRPIMVPTMSRCGVTVHRDEEVLGVEAVHLQQLLVQVACAVDDDRDEVVVVLDLRPLVELHGVLDRERVDLEYLAEQGEHLVVDALQVQPEQPVGFQGQLDVGASELVLQ